MSKVKDIIKLLEKQPQDNEVYLMDKNGTTVRHFEIRSNDRLTIFTEAEYKLHDKGF